ncbi:MAG: hypothetical protein HY692_08470 [Cyanobacteria bacterium NC_groundwater_1444_Ag_S-0.65um_54_12]|nr:hypothetical protein [Cyanobacteria bacterium NC_groundwater_1444_Ag_S-0.65um_54_12]
MKKHAFILAFGTLALTGCATYVAFGLITSSFQQLVILRSLTLLPPASPQSVTAIMGPIDEKVTKIVRESAGALASTREFTGSEIGRPIFMDSSISADVYYRYTLYGEGGASRSNGIQPVSVLSDTVTLLGPGTGSMELLDPRGGIATPSVAGGKPTFSWAPVTSSNPDYNIGYFLLVTKVNTSNLAEIKPVYSVFLDGASHSAGVEYGTKSDLRGFSSELLDFLKGVPALGYLAPNDAKPDKSQLDPLPGGQYGWTILTVTSDKRNIAFGIGKVSAPTDSKRYLFFQVP